MDDISQQSPASTNGVLELDEGFAEGSQYHGDQAQNSFLSWLNTQSGRAKADLAYEILRTLRSSEISAVVERLNPLLHMDPIDKLPAEIVSEIFSNLDASTLLTASLSSTTWRQRILDPQLWAQLYHSEGWGIDMAAIRAFEEAHTDLVRTEFRKARSQQRNSTGQHGQPKLKKRATSDWLKSAPRRVSAHAEVGAWREQHGTVEADQDSVDDHDSVMIDAPVSSPQRPNKRPSADSVEDMDLEQEEPASPALTDVFTLNDREEARINWHFVYKQRFKLEQNWLRGRYKMFQLPHPDHPREAHTECVYTIQFFGKWLVSGSRDKTLRIWDLDTRRLKCKPLVGHSQSVLCLQFDPTEEEDIIISGSSDASIAVWKFSTGQRLHMVKNAHDESVLNLRFDKRYLVTCSKDRKIKVWNRQELAPGHVDYPPQRSNESCSTPNHIIDTTGLDISLIESRLAKGVYQSLAPFTHIMTFAGHHAAVNAIQIHENQIVSASGDRMIRLWNLTTGSTERVIQGHQKGIACVQYDGRRIISGSSDNTVRIYDPKTGTEVAVLMGHRNLVRTIQAGFGDSDTIEENYAAARAADARLHNDKQLKRLLEDRDYFRRVRKNEFGSSRFTQGSHLPPGGGGTKWARIVSGSYDESIIIWKKDLDGNWVVGQTLRQGSEKEGERESEEPEYQPSQTPHQNDRQRRRDNRVQRTQTRITTRQPPATPQTTVAVPLSATQIVQATMNTSIASIQASVQNVVGLRQGLSTNDGEIRQQILNRPEVQNAVNSITAGAHRAINDAIANAIVSGSRTLTADITANVAASRNEPQTPAGSTEQISPVPPPAPQPPAPQALRQQLPTRRQDLEEQRAQSLQRVFKLQFDSRRIVCCSQASSIKVWDFANDDPEIEMCTKFFTGP